MPRDLGSTRHQKYRVIDTWIYKVKDVEIDRLDWQDNREEDATFDEKYKPRKERIRNKTVTMELRMEKRTEQSEEPPHPLQDAHFELVCSELDIKLEGTDIEALRAAMWGLLDKRFEVKWERYYLVQIRKDHPYHADGTGMELSYDDVYRGTTWNGKFLMKRWRGHEQKIEPWPGQFTDGEGKVIACIPATEENKVALEQFCERIDLLGRKLADFLRPENINATLSNLAGLALLPPAQDEPTPKEAVVDIPG